MNNPTDYSRLPPRPNQHVRDFLHYYTQKDTPTPYAVLLHGKWGSGKTHFIKALMNEWKELTEDEDGKQIVRTSKPPIYISLYGLQTITQIKDSIFAEIHPILTSKPAKFISRLGKDAIKLVMRSDVDGDQKPDAIATITPNSVQDEIKDWITNVDDRVLIFDDLERCLIPLDTVLGYINGFVEHLECKVIIIANEDEISDMLSEENQTNKRYRLIKEKLIGKTFHIQPDASSSSEAFFNSAIKISGHSQLLNTAKPSIIKTHYASKTNNLRHMQRSFLDLNWVINQFSASLQKKINTNTLLQEFLKKLALEFSIYTYELGEGYLEPDMLHHLSSVRMRMSVTSDSKKARKEITEEHSKDMFIAAQRIYNCYFELFHPWSESVLSPASWASLLRQEKLPQKFWEQQADEYERNHSGEAPYWRKLTKLHDLSTDEFNKLRSEAHQKLQEGAEEHPGVLFHIFGIETYLASKGFGHKGWTPEMVISYATKYIKSLSQDQIKSMPNFLEISDSWGGLGYWGLEVKGFRQFIHESTKQLNQKKLTLLAQEQKKELMKNLSNKDWLYQNITFGQNSHAILAPLLKRNDADAIWQHFSSEQDINGLKIFITCVTSRYRSLWPDLYKTLKTETEFLNAMQGHIKNWNVETSVPYSLAKEFMLTDINKAINNLESSTKKS